MHVIPFLDVEVILPIDPHHKDYWIIQNYVTELFPHHRDSHH